MTATLKQRLIGRWATFKFRAQERLGPLLLQITTLRARRRLRKSGSMTVLVDTSVLVAGVTHESRWVSTGVRPWGNTVVDTGYQARVPVKMRPARDAAEHLHRDYRDSCYLNGIAYLAKLGHIHLRTSAELISEQWSQSSSMFMGHNLFSKTVFGDMKIESVDGYPDLISGPSWMKLPSLEDRQRERLAKSKDPLYLGILKRLGAKSSQDAWHIKTAEENDMYCFLTTDYTLIRNLASQSQQEPIRSLRTQVLSPTSLGLAIGLHALDPKYLSHQGASFFVRPDLHMPAGKRRQKRPSRR